MSEAETSPAAVQAARRAAVHRPPPRQWGRPDGWRLALYGLLFCITLLVNDGQALFVITACVVSINLLRQLRHSRPFFSMTAVWEVAFLFIVCTEGLFDWATIVRHVGREAALEAARYLTAANALVMVGHACTFRRWRGRSDVSVVLSITQRRGVVWFMAALTLFYVVRSAGVTLEMFLVGRVGSSYTAFGSSAIDAVIQGLNASIGLILPCMIGYYVLWVRQGRLRTAILYCLPIMVLHFMGGTRFTLLFSLGGLMIMRFVRDPMTGRKLGRMLVALLAVLMLTGVMSSFRTFGVLGERPRAFDRNRDAGAMLHSEGVVRGVGELVRYFSAHNHLGGASLAGVLVFWVPRAVWPDQPTLLGYWFPRAYNQRGIRQVTRTRTRSRAIPCRLLSTGA
jgi:hypothetical protein